MRKRSIIASLLLVLLFGTMTMAAWHHHDKSKIESCQACHLNKHCLAPPAGGPVVGGAIAVITDASSYSTPLRERVAFTRADFRAPPA